MVGAKKILVVDDEQDTLISMKMLLENSGYVVNTVVSGKDALNLLKKEKFDLVLLDVMMPEMSGREVLEKIRADSKLKKQNVAFLSVVSLAKVGEKVIGKLKLTAFIDKTLSAPKILKKIKNALK
jgi:CheY-like chemotaxis protein